MKRIIEFCYNLKGYCNLPGMHARNNIPTTTRHFQRFLYTCILQAHILFCFAFLLADCRGAWVIARILFSHSGPRGYSRFQVTRMIKWSQKSRPPKIPRASSKTPKTTLDQKLIPKICHGNFVALKSSRIG